LDVAAWHWPDEDGGRRMSRGVHAQQLRRPATQVSTTDSQFGTRIGFDPKARTVAESCNAATQPDQPAAHPTRPF
jgi:hypothetical protein